MMLGWTLALGAAVAWGALDALRKRLAGRLAPIPLATLLTLGPVLPFAAWALVDGGVPEPAYLLPGAAALVLNVFANVGFVSSLRLSPLGATIPMLSLTPVFSLAGAALILGERPSPAQLVGVLLVVVGALSLPWASGAGAHPLRAMRAEPGVPLMAGVALLWALVLVVDKAALRHASVPMHLLVQSAGVGALLLAWLAARRRLPELRFARTELAFLLLAVLVQTAAMALQLLALKLLLVGVVDAIKRAVGMAMSLVNGRLWFGEPVRPGQVVILAAMAAGVALLVL